MVQCSHLPMESKTDSFFTLTQRERFSCFSMIIPSDRFTTLLPKCDSKIGVLLFDSKKWPKRAEAFVGIFRKHAPFVHTVRSAIRIKFQGSVKQGLKIFQWSSNPLMNRHGECHRSLVTAKLNGYRAFTVNKTSRPCVAS